MSQKTYAGAAKHLERAVIVGFYRTAESLGVPRQRARVAVQRADRWLQAIGIVYIVVAVVVVTAVVLANVVS